MTIEWSGSVALVLSGGNALGAYHAGAYQALETAGLLPDWIVGASVGALTGAILCGNPPERRLDRLRAFWGADAATDASVIWSGADTARRSASAIATFGGGRPGMFVPRHLFGPCWNPFLSDAPASLYDATPMTGTLASMLDFGLLNAGTPRFAATAVDIETGADVVFDTLSHRIGPEHVRASSALLPAFAPMEIGGRMLGDGGLSANLPLDVVLSAAHPRPLLCIAVDLLPRAAPVPRTLGEAASRTQDLLFAAQSRRSIAAWHAILAARGAQAPAVTLVHVAYSDQQREVAGKAFDFSPESVAARWNSGRDDLSRALASLPEALVGAGEPGLRVLGLGSDGLVPATPSMAPDPG